MIILLTVAHNTDTKETHFISNAVNPYEGASLGVQILQQVLVEALVKAKLAENDGNKPAES